MLLMGWTPKQWGLAISNTGVVPASLVEAVEVRKSWLIRHQHDPIEELIVYSPDGDTRECDYVAAYNLFSMRP